MENASKALIIAGAILIAILLISIGIILINSGRDITSRGTSGMQSQNIQSFNSQFTPYEGTKKGSEIRGVFSTVAASNASDEVHQVEITGVGSAGELVATRNYTVSVSYSVDGSEGTTEAGYIWQINIQ